MLARLKLTFGVLLGIALSAGAETSAIAAGGAFQKIPSLSGLSARRNRVTTDFSKAFNLKNTDVDNRFRTSFAQKMLRSKRFDSRFGKVRNSGGLTLSDSSDRRRKSRAVESAHDEVSSKEIYGSVIYSSNTNNSPVGFYKIPVSDVAPDVLPVLSEADYDISTAVCGVWYEDAYMLMNLTNLYGETYPELNLFDIETGSCKLTTDLDASDFAFGLAVDPLTNIVYGLFLNESGNDFDLGIFNVEEGISNHIAPLYGLNAADLAFTPDGKLFALDSDGNLYEVNKSSGVYSLVAATDAVSDYYSTLVGDPDSNMLYFIGTEDSGSYLYSIDATSGKCEYMYEMPYDEEVIGGFFMPETIAEAAPGAATDLTADFEPGKMTGNLSFVMPATTIDGSPLTGMIKYVVTANGQPCNSGSALPGSRVSFPLGLNVSDLYAFVVKCSNDAGTGKSAVCTVFVGEDSPKAPTGVALQLEGNQLTLEWNAVEESKFGGDISVDRITYAVTPYIDGVAQTVITGLQTPTYVTEIDGNPETVVRYSFGVATEYDGVITSALTLSNTCIAGAFTPPYNYSFSTQKDMANSFTVIDANADGVKWHVATDEYSDDSGSISVAMIDYNSDQDLDDWLITSPVRLLAGNRYMLSFKALPGMEETMEVFCGNQPTATGMTRCIMEPFILDESNTLVEYTVPFSVEANGKYYIGFHAISEADNFYIYLNDIAISAPVLLDAPAAPSVTAKALPEKALGAEITVVAPDTTLSGNTVSTLDKIELYRSDELINTFTDVEPGKTYTYIDNNANQGDNSYIVKAYNNDGISPESTCSVFVGIGKPIEPVNVRIEEIEQGKVRLTWDPVTADELGNTLTADEVTYVVAEYFSSSNMYVRAAGLTAPEFEYVVAIEDYQTFTRFAVFAATVAGKGYGTLSPSIPVGKPFEMPFNESFAQAAATHGFVYNDIVAGGYWRFFNDASFEGVSDANGDNGFIGFLGDSSNQSSMLLSGKIAVRGDNPALSFALYGNGDACANTLSVYAVTPEDTTELISLVNNTNGWNQYTLSLKRFEGKVIQLGFKATIKTHTIVLLDNISVFDGPAYDLSAESISAPVSANANQAHRITVTVRNRGTEPSGDFVVQLYANGEKQSALDVVSMLPNTAVNVVFEEEFTPVSPQMTEYYAEIISENDTEPENNTTDKVCVALRLSELPTATDLAASVENGTVTLTWGAASDHRSPELITEDFEDYESYATEIGEWTLVDNDGQPAGGIQGAVIPGHTSGVSPISYMVWDSQINLGADFLPHSGDKYIANMYRYDDGVVSDWIISPELNGEAQTISLYARSYSQQYKESFRILASSTDRELDSFTEVARYENIETAWTKFEGKLLAGTKYFAIETFSEACFFISFDDITYAPARVTYSPVGYNIYRDGLLVNDAPVYSTRFTDVDVSEGTHTYVVTTLFDLGESAPSKPMTVNVDNSGILSVDFDSAADNSSEYFDIRGVKNLNPTSGVYIRVKGDKVEKIYKR